MEARVGIEPTHKGFADLSLTAWVPRHLEHCTAGPDGCRFGDCIFQTISPIRSLIGHKAATWSGRRDLNPRPSPWQGDALPLSYSRIRPQRVYRAVHSRVNEPPIPRSSASPQPGPPPYRRPGLCPRQAWCRESAQNAALWRGKGQDPGSAPDVRGQLR